MHSHEGLGWLVGKVYEHGIVNVGVGFGNAVPIHRNYCHPWIDRATVKASTDQVRGLMEKVGKAMEQSVCRRSW